MAEEQVMDDINKWTFPLCPKPPKWELHWEGLLDEFDILAPLQNCMQDSAHHEEGDVLNHTKLVCEALVADMMWRELPPHLRSLSFAAALFHDVGKPEKTEVESDGRITSFGHGRKGARLIRSLCYRRNIAPFELREQLYSLIRFHALPRQWVNRENALRDVINATMDVPGKLFTILGRADSLGRICSDRKESAEGAELFGQYCQDIGCYEGPRTFPSALTRFLFLSGERPSPDVKAYDSSSFQVVLMAGLPGAGKDSWLVKEREKGSPVGKMPIISLDEIRKKMGISPADNQGQVVDEAKEEARKLLRHSKSFVWNATNVSRTLRGSLVSLFRRYGARVRLVYCETTYADLVRRNDGRQAHVPLKVIEYLINKLDVPTYDEAQEIEWVLS